MHFTTSNTHHMKKPTSIADLGEGVTVIVITGGPCSGKTTGLSVLRTKLTERGYKVLVNAESATKLISAGMLPGQDGLTSEDFQRLILLDTLEQEELILSAAIKYRNQGKKVVVLCDRGAMDGGAYVKPEDFKKLLEEFGYNHRQLCDNRYHAVMHMRSAAIGAESFYTLANNSARTETPEVARHLDEKTLEVWQRHPHPRVIDNSTDFKGKINRLLAEVCIVLGDPEPIENEEKFLVDSSQPITIPLRYTESTIIQDYLVATDPRETHRVRVRFDGDGVSYYFTRKRFVAPGKRVEIERMISRDEYEYLLTRKDYRFETIKKRRVCFFWREKHIELDYFEPLVHRPSAPVVMEIEHNGDATLLELPPFIKVIRNITEEREYGNEEIARIPMKRGQ